MTKTAEVQMLPAATEPKALLKSLQSRYSVKKFDPAGRVEADAWEALEQALVLSPSSFGLQPWKFFVVEDKGLRAELQAASWGQSQVKDADKVVVFAARKGLGPGDVERYLARIAQVRAVTRESLAGYGNIMLEFLKQPREVIDAWVARQVYIALGVFLASAAALGVDACPMEGIEPAKYDELLGLGEKGYTALCVATAGVRAANDGHSKAAKVRFPREQVVEQI